MKQAMRVFAVKMTVAFIACMVISIGIITNSEAETKVLKWAHAGPPVGVHPKAQKWMAEEITKKTNGEIKFEFHWSGTLINIRDIVSGVGKGVADFASPSVSMFTIRQNPHWTTLLLGFGNDYWALQMAGYELMNNNPYILAEFDKYNVVPTHGYVAGTDLFIFRDQVKGLDGMKGKRVRVFGPIISGLAKEVNMVPVSTPLWDVHQNLEKGVIDGAFGAVNHYHSLKWYEVAKNAYYRDLKSLCGDCTTLINKDTWKSLSAKAQNVIKEVSKEYNDQYVRWIIEAEDSWIKEMEAAGAKLHEFSPDANAAFMEATKKVREDWFKKYDSDGNHTKEVYNQLEAALKKYEKEVAEKGYPWQR